ncbi:MAG: peptidase, partial [Calditrichota bacterium]
MSEPGYYRDPTIYENTVVFVSEADLWQVPLQGGTARRLTANRGKVSRPLYSPDGALLAFTGREEGQAEIYVMPAEGGNEQRLTYLGGNSYVVGWTQSGSGILFASNAAQPFSRFYALWEVDIDGGAPRRLPYGLAHAIALGNNGGVVLGRNTGEPARWKRYRGGTAGRLWIDPGGSGRFSPLIKLDGNLASPLWVGERIYFISDHEGVGNLYSVSPDGEDLYCHTKQTEFYARNASSDGTRIVYHAGGELYLYDPVKKGGRKIKVDYHSPRTSRQRRFVSAGKYMEEYRPHPNGDALITVHRGKIYTYANWDGAVEQVGEPHGVRYQRAQWLADGESILAVSDAGGEEHLEIYTGNGIRHCHRIDNLDIGRPLLVAPAPTGRQIALTNHRHEVILVDLESEERTILDRSEYDRIQGLDWSPDGKWLAYSAAETQHTYSLKIAHIETAEIHRITPPLFRDISPSFDPDGNYLYFLSYREFNPVYDSMYFDLNFPRGVRPFLITLRRDVSSPFVPGGTSSGKSAPEKSEDREPEATKHEPEEIVIDFDGIEQRVVQFPIPEARYRQIWGVEGKVLTALLPSKGYWINLIPQRLQRMGSWN